VTYARTTALLLTGILLALPAGAQDAPAPAGPLEELDRAVRAVVEEASPAVVRVDVERNAFLRVMAGSEAEQRRMEDLLRRQVAREWVTATGFVTGSGDVVVTTSAAVDRNVRSIRVTFPRGEVRPGRFLGSDPLAGVAVVRIDPVEGGKVLRLATGKPRVASLSLLLGRTTVEAPTLHLGFLTAVGRSVGPYDAYLLSSVPFHPGDAGGPLLDSRGEVLGVAVAAREDSPVTVEGNGRTLSSLFAEGNPGEGKSASTFVPAGELRRLVDEITRLGRVRRGMLGVRLVPGRNLVLEVPEGLPAAEAGIRAGDQVVAVDGSRVITGRELVGFIQRRAPGTRVSLGVRDAGGEHRTVAVLLGELPETPPAPAALFNGLGVSEGPAPDMEGVRFSAAAVPEGRAVIVRSVAEASAAEVAGLEPGDWIAEISGVPVLSEGDYVRLATGCAPGTREVELRIFRAGERDLRTVVLR